MALDAELPSPCALGPENSSASEEFRGYETLPPKRVFFVRVRYRRLGPGKPLPLDPEDRHAA
jgi:hypothetical protein